MMERSRSRLNTLQQLQVADRQLRQLVDILVNKDRSVDWIYASETVAGSRPVFENGWVNFGSGEESAGFSRTHSGLVILKGRIKSGVMGQVAFELPQGFTPSGTKTFPVD